MNQQNQYSLSDLSARGEAVTCAGNLPLALDDPHLAWYVEQGSVDVFLLEKSDGVESSAPQHVLHAQEGRLLFGVPPKADAMREFSLVAKGMPGTRLRELNSDELIALDAEDLAAQVDHWLSDLAEMLARDEKPVRRPDFVLAAGETVKHQGSVASRRGVVWISELPARAGFYMGLVGLDAAADRVPITPITWLSLTGETEIAGKSSETLAREGQLLSSLPSFHEIALSLEILNRSLAIVDLVNLDRAQLDSRRSDEINARKRLFNLLGFQKEAVYDTDSDSLFAAIGQIGRFEKVQFKFPASVENLSRVQIIETIADLSGIRARAVNIEIEERWWIEAGTPFLAFNKDDGRPITLVPGRTGRFVAVDSNTNKKTRVTADYAATLEPIAWTFCPPLPTGTTNFGELLRTGMRRVSGEISSFLAAGLLIGLAAIAPAVIAGILLDQAVPGKDFSLLWVATGALIAVAVLEALLHLYQGTARMRLEGRVVTRMEAAFWDRLFRLPLDFLQHYPSGDISMRGLIFGVLRDNVLGTVITAVISVLFILPIFAFIFIYQDDSAFPVGAFAGGGVVIILIIGMCQIKPQTQVFASQRTLAGLLLQFVRGIPRFRIGNAEGSAYAIWARDYLAQKKAEIRVGNVSTVLMTWQTAFGVMPGVILMAAVPVAGDGAVSAGGFIVVYLLFHAFMANYGRLSAVFSQVSTVKPSLDLLEPFLKEKPEVVVQGNPVGELGGAVSLDHVSFRYYEDGPLILDDVSMEFRPGEFVAIAGESGAGKSTIFRLLLGLDQPDTGTVKYDDRDIQFLNLRQLRRQIGVVPQDARLFPQDLWDNIVGDDRNITDKDVSKAMELADIADTVAAMPMGPFTFVGAGSLSGGESQRVRIARAVLRNPRIVLLDEATNALGNDSQAVVMENLGIMTSTRIVIAHRLSTLREADRIYVLQGGKIAQQGSFDELTEQKGLFRDLVRRQMV